jgi:predicted GNAT family N-acyltransferase
VLPHCQALQSNALHQGDEAREIRYSKRMVPEIIVRSVTSSADRDAAYTVRRVVFQDEQQVPPELEFDADDDIALHVIAVAGGNVIGTARLVVHDDYAKVGRMAVLSAWRRSGAGRMLMDALVAEAVRHRVPRLVLHAQVPAIGFYRRCGFTVTSDEFDEAGIPHRRMERKLKEPKK